MHNRQATHFGRTPLSKRNGSAEAIAYTSHSLNTPLSGWEFQSRQLSAEECVNVAI